MSIEDYMHTLYPDFQFECEKVRFNENYRRLTKVLINGLSDYDVESNKITRSPYVKLAIEIIRYFVVIQNNKYNEDEYFYQTTDQIEDELYESRKKINLAIDFLIEKGIVDKKQGDKKQFNVNRYHLNINVLKKYIELGDQLLTIQEKEIAKKNELRDIASNSYIIDKDKSSWFKVNDALQKDYKTCEYILKKMKFTDIDIKILRTVTKSMKHYRDIDFKWSLITFNNIKAIASNSLNTYAGEKSNEKKYYQNKDLEKKLDFNSLFEACSKENQTKVLKGLTKLPLDVIFCEVYKQIHGKKSDLTEEQIEVVFN